MPENENDSTEGEQIARKHRHLARRPTEIYGGANGKNIKMKMT